MSMYIENIAAQHSYAGKILNLINQHAAFHSSYWAGVMAK